MSSVAFYGSSVACFGSSGSRHRSPLDRRILGETRRAFRYQRSCHETCCMRVGPCRPWKETYIYQNNHNRLDASSHIQSLSTELDGTRSCGREKSRYDQSYV